MAPTRVLGRAGAADGTASAGEDGEDVQQAARRRLVVFRKLNGTSPRKVREVAALADFFEASIGSLFDGLGGVVRGAGGGGARGQPQRRSTTPALLRAGTTKPRSGAGSAIGRGCVLRRSTWWLRRASIP